jgi:hypothetical protein
MDLDIQRLLGEFSNRPMTAQAVQVLAPASDAPSSSTYPSPAHIASRLSSPSDLDSGSNRNTFREGSLPIMPRNRQPSSPCLCTYAVLHDQNRTRNALHSSQSDLEEYSSSGTDTNKKEATGSSQDGAPAEMVNTDAGELTAASLGRIYPVVTPVVATSASPQGFSVREPSCQIQTTVANATTAQRVTMHGSMDRKHIYSTRERLNLDLLPNEILMHILSCLDVCDLLATSRVC